MTDHRKYTVGILGATGAVGQRFIQYLENHPWFEIGPLMASGRSVGKKFTDAANWYLNTPLPLLIKDRKILPCEPHDKIDFVFSGLEASVAGSIETSFAQNGIPVISNTRTHRMDPQVPLVVPEINPNHLKLIEHQETYSDNKGFIVTNPNCSTIILSLAVAPLLQKAGIEKVFVTTMQALSGAGYPGVSSLDIIDNVIPFIKGEEEKLETEPLKIFGVLNNDHITYLNMNISARCHRVNVFDGHLMAVSIKLKKESSIHEVIQAWEKFQSPIAKLKLPSSPESSIVFLDDERPQPRKHRMVGRGMSVVIGGLRRCSVLDYQFSILGHNTIRGAVGGSVLIAELLVKTGYL